MIEIFPRTYDRFACPACKSGNSTMHKIIFQGIHLLADLECTKCGFTFYHDFPVGHGITYAAIIDKKIMRVMAPLAMDWYTKPLVDSLQHPSADPIAVAIKKNGEAKDTEAVIFLNCLDAWYGHVLLKLMNVQFYHDAYPGYKKIVLVPEKFTWMVPAYVEEVWSVDLSLPATKNYYLQLDQFIHQQLTHYKQVFHGAGYSHPQLQHIRAKDFFGIEAFDLGNFNKLSPKITLIYREDRLWINPFLNKIFNFLNLRKIRFANGYFLRAQARNFNRLVRAVKKSGIDVEFVACGLGTHVKLGNEITDKRVKSIGEKEEREWCSIYAASHLVIGMHGSNMLIPSALAAGWIEILPNDRLGNITQDLFCKYEASTMLFLGRFVSEYDPPAQVALVATSILNYYSYFWSHKTNDYEII